MFYKLVVSCSIHLSIHYNTHGTDSKLLAQFVVSQVTFLFILQTYYYCTWQCCRQSKINLLPSALDGFVELA